MGGIKRGWIVAGGILLVLLIMILIVLTQFNITTIQVTGNVHYTDEEIIGRVVGDGVLDHNVLFLYMKNRSAKEEPIPFVDKVEVEYVNRHTVTLTVYEKAMAGCVKFMDQYFYFDKDGMVLESSPERIEDIPCISGIHFDHMIMHETLPIEDKEFFRTILTMTQLLNKYEIPVDTVRFTTQNEIVLYYRDIRILLGSGENIEVQISELPRILETIEGKRGTLYMKDYSIDHADVIFRENE